MMVAWAEADRHNPLQASVPTQPWSIVNGAPVGTQPLPVNLLPYSAWKDPAAIHGMNLDTPTSDADRRPPGIRSVVIEQQACSFASDLDTLRPNLREIGQSRGATPWLGGIGQSCFINTVDLLEGIGLSSQDKDLRTVGLALSFVPPVNQLDLFANLIDYTQLPALDLLGSAFSLIGSVQSCGIQQLPQLSYDPRSRQLVAFGQREQASDYNPYRDRHLEEVVVRIKQPLWRRVLSVASVGLGAGLTLFTPCVGGIFAGVRLSEDLTGFVRVKVPRGTRLKPVMTREELAYTLAWINYTNRRRSQ